MLDKSSPEHTLENAPQPLSSESSPEQLAIPPLDVHSELSGNNVVEHKPGNVPANSGVDNSATTATPVLPPSSSSPILGVANGDHSTEELPLDAVDTDRIGKAWVEGIKNALQQTSGDPHKRSEVVEGIKIDYMKKRYNREPKQSI